MKKDIHPQYYPKTTIACACGTVFTVGSTIEQAKIELCSSCHPFYTGQQKIVDTARRVEKFEARTKSKRSDALDHKAKAAKKTARAKSKADKRAKADDAAIVRPGDKKPTVKKTVKKVAKKVTETTSQS